MYSFSTAQVLETENFTSQPFYLQGATCIATFDHPLSFQLYLQSVFSRVSSLHSPSCSHSCRVCGLTRIAINNCPAHFALFRQKFPHIPISKAVFLFRTAVQIEFERLIANGTRIPTGYVAHILYFKGYWYEFRYNKNTIDNLTRPTGTLQLET